jgi:hypothetical protein
MIKKLDNPNRIHGMRIEGQNKFGLEIGAAKDLTGQPKVLCVKNMPNKGMLSHREDQSHFKETTMQKGQEEVFLTTKKRLMSCK